MAVIYCSISMRSHIGVAMVCMINATAVHEMAEQKVPKLNLLIPTATTEATPIEAQCSRHTLNQSEIVESGYKGTFLWSTEMQSLIISASFYGNFLIIWFTGYFCDVYGPRIVALIGVFGMSVATCLSPTIASWNYYVFFGLRMIFGLFESPALPSMSAMAARWFPPSERSTIAAIITSGNQLSASLGVVIATNLCSLHFLDGWPLIFYLAALIGFTWCILWGFFATDNPSDSKFLSQEEKDYLFEENGKHHQSSAERKQSGQKMPLKSMIFSKATFAVISAQFAFNFTNTMMQAYLPSYSRDVLVLDLKENGIFTALPFFIQLISKISMGIFADFLKRKQILSPTTSCKIFQSLASFGCGIIYAIMALYVDCTKTTEALVLLGFFGFFLGGAIPGSFTASLSIAPMYAGMIASFTLIAGAFGNILAPAVVGFFVEKVCGFYFV
uniref:Major facilitator superfamily (MFS) profile domain-containing protein n=1 Tax=Panagrolaimus sp. PS1159 TaxID=55785 RepID=A0AC35F317_9BILA